MSKKRGGKKNQEFDDDFEQKNENQEVTSKSKAKSKKKGKGNAGDDYESDDGNTVRKVEVSDEEGVPQPVKNKKQKKGKYVTYNNPSSYIFYFET